MTAGSSSRPGGPGLLLPCPLCQDECPGLASLEGHLAQAHKLLPEGMHKPLSMVELPPLTATHPPPPPAPAPSSSGAADHPQEEAGVTSDGRPGAAAGTAMASSSSSSSSSPSSWSRTLDEAMELDVGRLEDEHDQMVLSHGKHFCPVCLWLAGWLSFCLCLAGWLS